MEESDDVSYRLDSCINFFFSVQDLALNYDFHTPILGKHIRVGLIN